MTIPNNLHRARAATEADSFCQACNIDKSDLLVGILDDHWIVINLDTGYRYSESDLSVAIRSDKPGRVYADVFSVPCSVEDRQKFMQVYPSLVFTKRSITYV